jgi:serine/threonine-protein kinase
MCRLGEHTGENGARRLLSLVGYMDLRGQRVHDRYLLGAQLGEGKDALVYCAMDCHLGRAVAVKLLRPQLCDDPTLVTRFEREARNASRLAHPNIVPIYDYGSALGTYYFVMEYVRGGHLGTYLQAQQPLAIELALRLGIEIADALGAAHARGLVHRDVKPANVLLTEDGHAKLTDFGIAKLLDVPALTQATAPLGAARYLAPEQASGAPVTPATDVYALGVLLYEMLAGRPPFTGRGLLHVAMQHLHATPPPLAELNPAVPPGLAALVARALAKDPAQRFADGAELMRALREQARALTRPAVAIVAIGAPAAWPWPAAQLPPAPLEAEPEPARAELEPAEPAEQASAARARSAPPAEPGPETERAPRQVVLQPPPAMQTFVVPAPFLTERRGRAERARSGAQGRLGQEERLAGRGGRVEQGRRPRVETTAAVADGVVRPGWTAAAPVAVRPRDPAPILAPSGMAPPVAVGRPLLRSRVVSRRRRPGAAVLLAAALAVLLGGLGLAAARHPDGDVATLETAAAPVVRAPVAVAPVAPPADAGQGNNRGITLPDEPVPVAELPAAPVPAAEPPARPPAAAASAPHSEPAHRAAAAASAPASAPAALTAVQAPAAARSAATAPARAAAAAPAPSSAELLAARAEAAPGFGSAAADERDDGPTEADTPAAPPAVVAPEPAAAEPPHPRPPARAAARPAEPPVPMPLLWGPPPPGLPPPMGGPCCAMAPVVAVPAPPGVGIPQRAPAAAGRVWLRR